ncbi:MAG: ferredoxin domain-containing protein, partial [Bacteroidales bacterium]|nr:ferredoxin domain-containing protein [Bacteroidales bacterium]
DNRVDNRIMYTAGQAVIELGLLGEDVKIVYVIPLSATSKNPFFDRK